MSMRTELWKHSRNIRPTLLAFLVWILFLGMVAAAIQMKDQQTPSTDPLMSRVGQPSELAVNEFRKAGMEEVRTHILTNAERAKVEAAIGSLPFLNRDALNKHLHQLAFVDGIPGEGTGLTSPATQHGQFDITFRASLINESLSAFLTTKERRTFTDDHSGTTVTVTGTGTDALTYVLLHESSHVLDATCGITKIFPNSFGKNIWTAEHDMAPSLAQLLAARTYFHGGARLPAKKAPEVYDSLSKTPFISLYATASAKEDFAELVAWREIQHLYGGTLTVAVSEPGTRSARVWDPLSFPDLQNRFAQVDQLERQGYSCLVN